MARLKTPAACIATELDFTALRTEFERRQEAFKTEHGRYWQGLGIHSAKPDLPKKPDMLKRKPRHEAKTWEQFAGDILPPMTKAQHVCHQYSTPRSRSGTRHHDDAGYVWVIELKVGGEIWERHINYGPDRSREIPWQVKSPE